MADESASLPPLGQNLDPYASLRQGYTLTYPVAHKAHPSPGIIRQPVNTLPVGPLATGPLAFPWASV